MYYTIQKQTNTAPPTWNTVSTSDDIKEAHKRAVEVRDSQGWPAVRVVENGKRDEFRLVDHNYRLVPDVPPSTPSRIITEMQRIAEMPSRDGSRRRFRK